MKSSREACQEGVGTWVLFQHSSDPSCGFAMRPAFHRRGAIRPGERKAFPGPVQRRTLPLARFWSDGSGLQHPICDSISGTQGEEGRVGSWRGQAAPRCGACRSALAEGSQGRAISEGCCQQGSPSLPSLRRLDARSGRAPVPVPATPGS